MSDPHPAIDPAAFPVRSVREWFEKWPPKKGADHWRDGKSAKELAKQWFPPDGGPVIPEGFRRLLEAHALSAALRVEDAKGEKVVPLDNFNGGQRNADLVLTGASNGKRVLVHVEAKADEAFGSDETVLKAFGESEIPGSKKRSRIANLSELLFGSRELSAAVGALKYQLFYSVAGALMDAETARADVAVFCVHELLPRDTAHGFVDEADGRKRMMNASQIAKNAAAVSQLIETLVAAHPGAKLHGGMMWEIGTFQPYVGGHWGGERSKRPITLLVGKATDWTT